MNNQFSCTVIADSRGNWLRSIPYWLFTIEKKRTRLQLTVSLLTDLDRPTVILRKTVDDGHVFLSSDDRCTRFHFEEMRKGHWVWVESEGYAEGAGEMFREAYPVVWGQAFLKVLQSLPISSGKMSKKTIMASFGF